MATTRNPEIQANTLEIAFDPVVSHTVVSMKNPRELQEDGSHLHVTNSMTITSDGRLAILSIYHPTRLTVWNIETGYCEAKATLRYPTKQITASDNGMLTLLERDNSTKKVTLPSRVARASVDAPLLDIELSYADKNCCREGWRHCIDLCGYNSCCHSNLSSDSLGLTNKRISVTRFGEVTVDGVKFGFDPTHFVCLGTMPTDFSHRIHRCDDVCAFICCSNISDSFSHEQNCLCCFCCENSYRNIRAVVSIGNNMALVEELVEERDRPVLPAMIIDLNNKKATPSQYKFYLACCVISPSAQYMAVRDGASITIYKVNTDFTFQYIGNYSLGNTENGHIWRMIALQDDVGFAVSTWNKIHFFNLRTLTFDREINLEAHSVIRTINVRKSDGALIYTVKDGESHRIGVIHYDDQFQFARSVSTFKALLTDEGVLNKDVTKLIYEYGISSSNVTLFKKIMNTLDSISTQKVISPAMTRK